MFMRGRFFLAVLCFATVMTIDRYRAGDKTIPVWPVFNDIMQIRHSFEKVFDRNGAILMVVDENGLPSLVAV